jgi:4-hydroxythreonine-4-phosphate dehydrogenase
MALSTSLAFTLGDPRGIGPEVMIEAIRRLRESAPEMGVRLIVPADWSEPCPQGVVLHRLDQRCDAGWTEERAGAFSVEALDLAIHWGQTGEVQGIVTGPVSKPALHAAGATFPGQTELLQDRTGAAEVGMLMASEATGQGAAPLRILLMTTHLALRDVPRSLTQERVRGQLLLLHDALRRGWGLDHPRIAVCALNPHASDGGLFGDEEARVLSPVIDDLQREGLKIEGPFPADTVFRRMLDERADAVAVPYHDVGMAVFKSLAFGSGVNVTLGLPFVRTSPDHGTAFDLVGRGMADASSAWAATDLARKLAGARR